ncbi:MAG: hypothetical protein DRR06_11520 [Gammaproteobacteria bacterium]|nr:MAG: hypothetical protein DRR06_11520 [Gammaproteobacteria bacterium]RLA49271.1 MAG: hypothetical protein DRR42_15795 [Gammaproteobacteria bacterium]
MSPEIEQFLSGMKKTIEEVVMPNLTDRFAQEQAGIVAATLGFLSTIQDKVFHYELFENQEYKRILQDVLTTLDADAEKNDAICVVVENVNKHFLHDNPAEQTAFRPYPFIRGSNENMKEFLCEFIQLQPDMPTQVRKDFEALLKPFFKSIETRERSWVKGLGFDPEAEQQADIGDLLYENEYLRGTKPQ